MDGERLQAGWWCTSAQAVCVQSCNRAKTTRGSRGISQEQVDSGGQVYNWFVVGVGRFWGAKLFPCLLTYFQNKILSGADVREERKLHCTISSAWQHRGTVDYWSVAVSVEVPTGSNVCVTKCVCMFLYMCAFTQAVEELLESLDLEKSSYHMGLSRVSNAITCQATALKLLNKPLLWIAASFIPLTALAAVHSSFYPCVSFLKEIYLSGGVCLSLHLSLFEVCLPSFFGELPSLAPSCTLLASGCPRDMSLPCLTMWP